jgi:hypothetical protein
MVRVFTFTGNDADANTAHQIASRNLNAFLALTELPCALLIGQPTTTVTALHIAGAGIQWHVATTLVIGVSDANRLDGVRNGWHEGWEAALGEATTFVNPPGL